MSFILMHSYNNFFFFLYLANIFILNSITTSGRALNVIIIDLIIDL